MKEVMVVLRSITVARFGAQENTESLQRAAAAVIFISGTMAKFWAQENTESLQKAAARVAAAVIFISRTMAKFQMWELQSRVSMEKVVMALKF